MAEQENPLQKIITKCWEDEAFKARLLADPAATLAAEGLQAPEGVTLNVAVDSEDVRTLVIPLPPTGELSDGELTSVAGGLEITTCRYIELVNHILHTEDCTPPLD